MGVQGLLSYCLNNQNQCCTFFDLVDVAREQQGIEILVDFYCFIHWTYVKFCANLSNKSGNKYLPILGGEYCSLSHYVSALIKNLQSVDIHLTFLSDGPKGSCKETTERKLNTWLIRSKTDIDKIQNMLSVFNRYTNIEDLSLETVIMPIHLERVFISTVKKCGCEVVNYRGEADDKIVKRLLDSNAFAILTNDSDFCILKDCRFIPITLFDIHKDLEIDYLEEVKKKPLCLQIGLITTEKVRHMFGMSFDELIELSIVAGNDLTRHFMRDNQRLLYQLDIKERKNHIENIVTWVKSYKRVENHPLLKQEIKYNSEFASAVQNSRSFFKLELAQGFEDKNSDNQGSLTKLIIERVVTKTISQKMLSVHYGMYWHKVVFEDLYLKCPGIETLLSQLRSCIYRILLSPDEMAVIEYGRDHSLNIMPYPVSAAKWKWLPKLEEIKKENISQNLNIFHKIITQQEPGWKTKDWPRNFFVRYGRHNGFIFYCLRYFLLLNWQCNLFISQREFLALICLVFTEKDEKQYQCYPLKPSARCVTINSWLQDIYMHAYGFLGGVLFLKTEFPTADELFSGSIWVVFYWCFCAEISPAQLSCQQRQVFEETKSKMNNIIHEKRHMIKVLVNGVFEFED